MESPTAVTAGDTGPGLLGTWVRGRSYRGEEGVGRVTFGLALATFLAAVFLLFSSSAFSLD